MNDDDVLRAAGWRIVGTPPNRRLVWGKDRQQEAPPRPPLWRYPVK